MSKNSHFIIWSCVLVKMCFWVHCIATIALILTSLPCLPVSNLWPIRGPQSLALLGPSNAWQAERSVQILTVIKLQNTILRTMCLTGKVFHISKVPGYQSNTLYQTQGTRTANRIFLSFRATLVYVLKLFWVGVSGLIAGATYTYLKQFEHLNQGNM